MFYLSLRNVGFVSEIYEGQYIDKQTNLTIYRFLILEYMKV